MADNSVEKHHLHGKIITDYERVPNDIIEGFKRHNVCQIADAQGLGGVMDAGIKPVEPSMRFVGSALTVMTKPGDGLYVKKAIEVVQPGDVVVIDGGGYDACSLTGERIAFMFQSRGAAAIVIDGGNRDSQGIIDQGMPVFSRGIVIRHIGNAMGPGAINVPIQCGRTLVRPGDVVVGDRDGVIVVPREDAGRILKAADDHLAGEEARMARVAAGESISDVWGLDAKLARWA